MSQMTVIYMFLKGKVAQCELGHGEIYVTSQMWAGSNGVPYVTSQMWAGSNGVPGWLKGEIYVTVKSELGHGSCTAIIWVTSMVWDRDFGLISNL